MNTEELSRQYSEQLAALRQEKDKELQSLRVRSLQGCMDTGMGPSCSVGSTVAVLTVLARRNMGS